MSALRLPWSLLAAALILVLTMGGGAWIDLRIDRMHARQVEISAGLEKTVRLNQALHAMLMIAVLEQNTLRSTSYDTVHAELELTLRTIGQLMGELGLTQEVAALGTQRSELHRVEQQVLGTMRNEQWPQARQLLSDDAYVLARKIHEIDSETAIGAIHGELEATARHFGRIRIASLAVRAAAVLLLLWAGVSFSRQMSRELAEQARLREEIAAANRQLEDKVRARTQELERANDRLEQLSTTDSLTGLANRRRFAAVWADEWHRASRMGMPLAVAMVDIDGFKPYNDHYGHPAGDECLRRVAAVLRTVAQRAGEMAARYGGEEFVLVLPGLGPEEATALAERLAQGVRALDVPHAPTSGFARVTVSVGVASLVPRLGDSAEGLLRAADLALYKAKQQGRDRVICADMPTRASTSI